MKRLWILVVLLGASCKDDDANDKYGPYLPHNCGQYDITSKHSINRCAHPPTTGWSVASGYLLDSTISETIDQCYEEFYAEFGVHPTIPVWLHDDYVYWHAPIGVWAKGDTDFRHYARVCIWDRGMSYTEPQGVWIKRAPGENGFGDVYDHWRYTVWNAAAFKATLRHEWGHTVFGFCFEHNDGHCRWTSETLGP